MEYVYTPWKDRLIEDLMTATEEVVLISPYIKASIARDIYSALANKAIKVRTISRFSKSEFQQGSSDIDAHFMLAQNSSSSQAHYEMRSLYNLHAKIFVIDWRIVYLGSSNLTFSGLLRNYEGTVRLTDFNEIAPLKRRFTQLWADLMPVTQSDFKRMLRELSSSKMPRRGEDSEHFYDIRRSLENDSLDQSTNAIFESITKSTVCLPVLPISPPCVADLITDTLKNATSNLKVELSSGALNAESVSVFAGVKKDNQKPKSEAVEGSAELKVSSGPESYAVFPMSEKYPDFEVVKRPEAILKKATLSLKKSIVESSRKPDRSDQHSGSSLPSSIKGVNHTSATPEADEKTDVESVFFEEEKKTRVALHAEILNRFLNLLSNRFDLSAQEKSTHYALVLKTPSVRGFALDELVDVSLFGSVDVERLYSKDPDKLETLGKMVYEFCTATISVKLGIVEKYGYQIAILFMQKARVVIRQIWNQNLLGPQLFGMGVQLERDGGYANNAVYTAFNRLIAAIYMDEGLDRTLQIVEEFMNPADILSTDIISLTDFEDSKTTLQNVLQANGGTKPIYRDSGMEGPEHNAVWRCHVQVGGGIQAEGEGASLRAAQQSAAKNALDLMRNHLMWAKRLMEYRNEMYSKAVKSNQPLFPRVDLTNGMAECVRHFYKTKFGMNMKPSLGYVACIDQETRKHMKISQSNATMAWYGSNLIQIFKCELDPLDSTATTQVFWLEMVRHLDINGLRRELQINVSLDFRSQHAIEIFQAIVAGFYFSESYEKVRSFVFELLRKAKNATTSKVEFSKDEKYSYAVIERLVAEFEFGPAYTMILQEIIQRRTSALPKYEVTKIDPFKATKGLDDAVEVTGVWQDLMARAQGKNKAVAKNKCAFELMRKLLAKKDFWDSESVAQEDV